MRKNKTKKPLGPIKAHLHIYCVLTTKKTIFLLLSFFHTKLQLRKRVRAVRFSRTRLAVAVQLSTLPARMTTIPGGFCLLHRNLENMRIRTLIRDD